MSTENTDRKECNKNNQGKFQADEGFCRCTENPGANFLNAASGIISQAPAGTKRAAF
jgi:hypothetical protein